MKKILTLIITLLTLHQGYCQSLLEEAGETDNQRIARELLAAPREMRDMILAKLESDTERLWSHPAPQDIIDAMGTKAVALFELNEAFTSKIQTLLTEQNDTLGLFRLQGITAKIQPHTKNPDGTITINTGQ